MEVHHHSHTERKKWTHYFWEFLMLFLAVLCGYIAEYKLEQNIERHREKEYMVSLVKDLQNDIAGMNTVTAEKLKRINMADTILTLFEKNDFKNNTGALYNIGGELGLRVFFNPNDGTIQQLKNAGGFRLIQKRNVVDSIQQYLNHLRDLLRLQELEELNLMEYRRMMSKIFSASIFNKMLPSNKSLQIKKTETNPPLIAEDRQSINDLSMKIVVTKGNQLSELEGFAQLQSSGVELINLIQKEYHLH